MRESSFNLSSFIPYKMAVLSERISKRIAVDYEQTHGLTMAEWRVLVHLSRFRAVSVREIQTYVNMDKPRVSRAVGRLEKAGLVVKSPGNEDARLVSISLSDKGQKTLHEILPVAIGFEKELFGKLTQAELEAFLETMEKLHSILDDDPDARPRSNMDREQLENNAR